MIRSGLDVYINIGFGSDTDSGSDSDDIVTKGI